VFHHLVDIGDKAPPLGREPGRGAGEGFGLEEAVQGDIDLLVLFFV
jgi:hypothetical protein